MDQADSLSPDMLGVHLHHTENGETNDDDVYVNDNEAYGRTYPHEDLYRSASEDNISTLSRLPVCCNRDTSTHSTHLGRRSSSCGVLRLHDVIIWVHF